LKCGVGEGGKYLLTYRVRNEELLQGKEEERNILHTINRRKTALVRSCVGTAF